MCQNDCIDSFNQGCSLRSDCYEDDISRILERIQSWYLTLINNLGFFFIAALYAAYFRIKLLQNIKQLFIYKSVLKFRNIRHLIFLMSQQNLNVSNGTEKDNIFLTIHIFNTVIGDYNDTHKLLFYLSFFSNYMVYK